MLAFFSITEPKNIAYNSVLLKSTTKPRADQAGIDQSTSEFTKGCKMAVGPALLTTYGCIFVALLEHPPLPHTPSKFSLRSRVKLCLAYSTGWLSLYIYIFCLIFILTSQIMIYIYISITFRMLFFQIIRFKNIFNIKIRIMNKSNDLLQYKIDRKKSQA